MPSGPTGVLSTTRSFVLGAVEQALPRAQRDRKDHQAVLVDEAVLGKASSERRAALHQDLVQSGESVCWFRVYAVLGVSCARGTS